MFLLFHIPCTYFVTNLCSLLQLQVITNITSLQIPFSGHYRYVQSYNYVVFMADCLFNLQYFGDFIHVAARISTLLIQLYF